jgi:hypothetical protein
LKEAMQQQRAAGIEAKKERAKHRHKQDLDLGEILNCLFPTPLR